MWSDDEGSEEWIEQTNDEKKFLWASACGKLDILKKALASSSLPLEYHDEDGYTALHKAASEGHIKVAKLLLSNEIYVNTRTIDGWTPLHSACKWNNVEIAHLLLSNSANVNALSNANATPLHIAASEQSCREVLILLLTNEDIDVQKENGSGDTAYVVAERHSPFSRLFTLSFPHINCF